MSKVALVTGAGTGIGRAIALELAKAGYAVGLHCNASTAGAESAAAEIRAAGGVARVYCADLADVAAIRKMFAAFQTDFGRLDLFVNNAGITLLAPFLEMTPEDFDKNFAVDFRAPDVQAVIERNIRAKLDEYGDKARTVCTSFGKRFENRLPELVREEVMALAEVANIFDDDIRKTISRTAANQMTAYLAENLPRIIEETDVWQIVYDTIMGYDEHKLEVLTREVANRELRGVTLWGGVIGAVVGLSMSVVMWLIG